MPDDAWSSGPKSIQSRDATQADLLMWRLRPGRMASKERASRECAMPTGARRGTDRRRPMPILLHHWERRDECRASRRRRDGPQGSGRRSRQQMLVYTMGRKVNPGGPARGAAAWETPARPAAGQGRPGAHREQRWSAS